MLLRSPISMVKHCCTCQGNYNSKLTHEQLEASGPILYKVSRNIRVTQTLSVERQLGAGHPEAVSKPWVCTASVGTPWAPMVRGTNASEVLGGVGLATPQPPSFAPGGLVLLLWGRGSIWANPATYLIWSFSIQPVICIISHLWMRDCFFPLPFLLSPLASNNEICHPCFLMMIIVGPAYRVLGWEAVGGGPHRWMAISCMTYHQWAGPLVPRGHGPRPREAQWVYLKVYDIDLPLTTALILAYLSNT